MNPIRKKSNKGTGLRFLRINDFALIPKRLLDQVEPRDCDPAAIYALGPAICADPRTVLGVFLDDLCDVQGFLWATLNPLDSKIHVQMLSVSEKFQGRGIVREARGILDRIKREQGMKALVFRTLRPELFEGLGFVRSRTIIMEET